MQNITHEPDDLDIPPRPSRPGVNLLTTLLVAAIILAAAYFVLARFAGRKVVHCQCMGGERDRVVSAWRSTDSECAAICAAAANTP